MKCKHVNFTRSTVLRQTWMRKERNTNKVPSEINLCCFLCYFRKLKPDTECRYAMHSVQSVPIMNKQVSFKYYSSSVIPHAIHCVNTLIASDKAIMYSSAKTSHHENIPV